MLLCALSTPQGAASYVVEANMTASLKEALKAMTSQTLESSALDAVLRAMEAVCSVEGCAKAFSVDVEVVSTLLRILAPAVEVRPNMHLPPVQRIAYHELVAEV